MAKELPLTRALPYHARTAPSPRSTLAWCIRAEAPRRAHGGRGNRGRSILLRIHGSLRTAPNKYNIRLYLCNLLSG